MVIEVREVTADRRDTIDALTAVRAVTEAELNPGDPNPPAAEVMGELLDRSIRGYHRGFVALVDGEPAGEMDVEFELSDDNRHIGSLNWLATLPAHRGRGVAGALLRTGLEVLADDHRTSLLAFVPRPASHAGMSKVAAAWAESLGLAFCLEERASRLRISDLDVDAVAAWSLEGSGRTDGYRIVQFHGAVPDEHMAALVDAQAAMADAPIDDMEWTPPIEDEAYIRSTDEARRRRGLTTYRTLAYAPDGSGAAISELHVNEHRRTLAWQGDTGVGRPHRGHGLGRWIKAENLRFVLEHRPEIEVIETHNAESNPWMLDINVAMGFRPHLNWLAYQGDLVTARERLG